MTNTDLSKWEFILVVDVDDTLVLWDDSKGVGTEFTINEPLKKLITWCLIKTKGLVVIWSGGGEDYARNWQLQLFKEHNRLVSSNKDSIRNFYKLFGGQIPIIIIDDDTKFLSYGIGLNGVYVYEPHDLSFLSKQLKRLH